MVEEKIIVKTMPEDPERGLFGEAIAVDLGDERIFTASRFDGEGYSTVYWGVDPRKNKVDYLKRLSSFYETLRTGGFNKKEIDLLPGISFDESTGGKFVRNYQLEIVALEDLAGEEPKIISHKRFNDFMLLRIEAPYAVMTMEDHSGTSWKPETGLIAIVSHNDLSKPVAKLIEETARYQVPAKRLQSILKRNVYTFQ